MPASLVGGAGPQDKFGSASSHTPYCLKVLHKEAHPGGNLLFHGNHLHIWEVRSERLLWPSVLKAGPAMVRRMVSFSNGRVLPIITFLFTTATLEFI